MTINTEEMNDAIEEAFSRLCALYQYGELSISANMPDFLNMVCSDIEILRTSLTDAMELANGGCHPNNARLETWRIALENSVANTKKKNYEEKQTG